MIHILPGMEIYLSFTKWFLDEWELSSASVRVLAEEGLILFTVVPVVVRVLSRFLCYATLAIGWEGWGRARGLTLTGQWDVHSIPCDTMMTILTGAVGVQFCGVGWCVLQGSSTKTPLLPFWVHEIPSPEVVYAKEARSLGPVTMGCFSHSFPVKFTLASNTVSAWDPPVTPEIQMCSAPI